MSSPHPVWFVCKTYIGSWTWQPMSAKSLALSHQGPWRCSVWLLVRSYTSVQWSKLDQCTAVYSSSLSSLAHHQKWVFRQCFILQWNRHIHHKNIARIANAVTITLYSKVTMYLFILLFSIVKTVISVSSVKSQVTKTFKKSENFLQIGKLSKIVINVSKVIGL